VSKAAMEVFFAWENSIVLRGRKNMSIAIASRFETRRELASELARTVSLLENDMQLSF